MVHQPDLVRGWISQTFSIAFTILFTQIAKEMDRPLKNLPLEELKKLLRRQTKSFIDGLENGITVAELKALRASMKDISDALEERTRQRSSSRP
jgi:hypothetical protein